MSPDRDSGRVTQDDLDIDERDESPRSIFSALWFRVLLAVLVLGVVAAVAVPYVIDSQTLKVPPEKSTAAPSAGAATAASATTAPTSEPATAPAETATSNTPAADTATARPAPATVPTAAPTAPPAVATARPKTATPAPRVENPEKTPPRQASPKSPTMVAKANDAAKPAVRAEKAPPRDAEPAKVEKPTPKSTESAKAVAGSSKTPDAIPRPSEPATKTADAARAAEPAAKSADASKPAAAKAASAPGGKAYWVQVGAFKDAETARRVASRLREGGLRVEESSTTQGSAAPRPAPAGPGADRYDVLVSGASAAEVDARLAPKGFKGEPTATGLVVRPSLALREAVALSRELADAGLSVQVRRIGGPAGPPPTAPAPAPASAAGQTLYRVRVGGFADRAGAVEAMKQLEAKGYKPFIARGNE